MTSGPAWTVAMPTCNGRRHLAEALQGILAQQGVAFELVVSDDRSDDDTLDVVRQVAGDRARVTVNSERLGLAGNWNQCIQLCRTEWLSIFHQDDVMRPVHLAAHAAAVASRPDLGLVCGAADVIDDAGNPVPPSVVEPDHLGAVDRVFEPGQFVRELAARNPVRCSATSLRRAVHTDIGGFNPTFRYALDWEFWLRAARSAPVAWLHRPTVAFRWHLASETHRFKADTKDLEEERRLIESVFSADSHAWPDQPALHRSANRRLARAYLNRAYEASRAGRNDLVRRCLRESIRLHPGIVGTVLRDPRLAARLALSCIIPSSEQPPDAGRGLS